MVCSTELSGKLSLNSVKKRVTERYRSGRHLATSHADKSFIVNSALLNWMVSATQLQPCLKGDERHPSVISDHSKPHTSAWSAGQTTCKDTWPHYQAQASSSCMGHEALMLDKEPMLLSDESWFITSRNHKAFGDIKPMLSPDEVIQSGQVCLVNTEQTYTLWVVLWKSQYYLNNGIITVIVPLHRQHRPDFIFMDDNAPAYQGMAARVWGTSNRVSSIFSRTWIP